ncbi:MULTISPECIES: hypothetical protein [unclassified Synechococcus]|uniref:hypothetical protein n=1 Tax=unclassified Synechococcus TaxID=2626047 RepID=UPI0021A868FF|nr:MULTISPECIES: hypothetical protein [unclassified Synechococcus]MCT0232242.1 hypothetical protein [Synechococcus sp. CS-1327]
MLISVSFRGKTRRESLSEFPLLPFSQSAITPDNPAKASVLFYFVVGSTSLITVFPLVVSTPAG